MVENQPENFDVNFDVIQARDKPCSTFATTPALGVACMSSAVSSLKRTSAPPHGRTLHTVHMLHGMDATSVAAHPVPRLGKGEGGHLFAQKQNTTRTTRPNRVQHT